LRLVAQLVVQPNLHKSPAVAKVSRPYFRHTLAACVHNCPIILFRTFWCLHQKCKRSFFFRAYLFAYQIRISPKLPLLPQNSCCK